MGYPVANVTAQELLAVVRRIENRGALETAHRALGNCGQVFRYVVATGRAMRDPCGDLRGALPPVKGEHFAATAEPKRIAAANLFIINRNKFEPCSVVSKTSIQKVRAMVVFRRYADVTDFGVPEYHGDGSALPMLVQCDNLSLEIWSSAGFRYSLSC